MKISTNIFKTLLCCFLFSILFVSCDSYLDREEDMSMTFEKIWERRATIQEALSNAWGYMTNPDNQGENHPFTGASDEATIAYNLGYRAMNEGRWNPSNPPYNKWPQYYRGIREATIFMRYVQTAPARDLMETERVQWYAEARFARAYYYYQLVQLFGPVMLLEDELLDFNLSIADLQRQRNSMDECVAWIISELKAVEEILPYVQPSVYFGKPTKGVCRTLTANLLLFYARPLYNGNTLYANMTNPDGSYLFPGIATVNMDRWRDAAAAAKAVIDMNQYNLHRVYTGGVLNPLESYRKLFLDMWSNEIIWGRFIDSFWMRVHTRPRGVGGTAYGGIGPTQQQVDAFAMANGRYPITGYNPDGSPIIDTASGYSEEGFTNMVHPIEGGAARSTFNMFLNREPRFYATVFWSDSRWAQDGSNFIVSFAFNGSSGPGPSHDYPWSGYMYRKYTDPSLPTGNWGRQTFPLYRLGQIYLNYVEALNEYDPSNPDIVTYLNLIRERAGVPNIGVVYPEAVGNRDLMRELIRNERRVELVNEQKRFFDTRTWMIAEQTDAGPMYGMNVMAPASGVNNTPAAFWQRRVFETRVFQPRHYLYPFAQSELDRNKLITQNYGW
ncbi:MAG: RagB/SusD family nutrient uptake outer membrane protein [Dysgonamonadaceae bacterium]|jgi:hypothetical protein|nr:RagB/SusD family nutrient uptake outer membrane protein [Dysgonamonadaceae bacterium]